MHNYMYCYQILILVTLYTMKRSIWYFVFSYDGIFFNRDVVETLMIVTYL